MRIGVRCRSLMLRAPSAVGGVVLLAAVAAGLVHSRAGEPPTPDPRSDGAQLGKTAALFAHRCARCHSDDGTGTSLRRAAPALPNFTSLHWQQQRSDAQLVVSILEGKGTQMPAFAGRLSRAEARALVRHIRTLAPQEMIDVTDFAEPDFHERFRQLEEEFERLRKQFNELRAGKD